MRRFGRRKHQQPSSVSGFTLIELMVAVTIILILLVVLLPTIAAGREKGKAARCAANLHVLCSAMVAYSAEYAYVPGALTDMSNQGVDNGYTIVTNTGTAGSLGDWNNISKLTCPTGNSTYGSNLGYTLMSGKYADTANSVGVTKLNNFEKPTTTVFVADTGGVSWDSSGSQSVTGSAIGPRIPWASTSDNTNTSVFPTANLKNQVTLGYFHGRHAKAGNVGWYDGHVSAEIPYIPVVGWTSISFSQYNLGALTPAPSSMSYTNFRAQSPTIQDQYFLIR